MAVDMLPPEGELANVLAWISNDAGGHSFFPVVLDGPGWVRRVEVFEPTYEDFPEVMNDGLYVLEIDVRHTTDAKGRVDEVVVRVHRVKRLYAPSRTQLAEALFDDFVTPSMVA